MVLLVKPSSLSTLRRPPNQDVKERPIETQSFPTSERRRGRSKRRWKTNSNRSRRGEIKKQGCCHGRGCRYCNKTETTNSESQRTVELSETDSETISLELVPQEVKENIACVDGRETNGDSRRKGRKQVNTKSRYFGRLSMLGRSRAKTRSSHPSSSLQFVRAIGNLGQKRRVSRAAAYGKCNEIYSNSSLFDFDEEDDDTYGEGEIHGTAQEGKCNAVFFFDFDRNIKDEELDPIFASDEIDNCATKSIKDEVEIVSPHKDKSDKGLLRDGGDAREDPESTNDCIGTDVENTIDDIIDEVSIMYQSRTTMQRKSPSREPEPLSAKVREQPMVFPIASEHRTQLVKVIKEENCPKKSYIPWFYSCGEVFVI